MRKTLFSLRTLTAGMVALLLLPACESGFEDLNKNPNAATTIGPQYLMPSAILAIAGTRYEVWRNNLIHGSAYVQQISHTWYAGDKYTQGSDDHQTAMWRVAYNGNGDSGRAYIKTLQDIIANNAEDPQAVNYVAAARVLRVYAFHRLTDMHGDIPYFEGARGYLDDNVTPRYDPQSEIYADMLAELAGAAAQFEAGKPLDGDLLYRGDVTRWRRFAHSMMLRLGMRLVKVDAGMAQQWVQKAIAGGVMQSNDDMAVVIHALGPHTGPNGLSSNGLGDVFEVDDPMVCRAFVEWMQSTGDPRLRVFSAMYDAPATAAGGGEVVSSDPADQVGWPVGNDAQTIQTDPFWNADLGFQSYAKPGPLVRSLDEPAFLQTYGEVEFLLAEAAVRGWHSGDPAAHYANGVRAAMKHVALYDPDGAADIDDDEIDAYLAANPYDAGNAMEQINTQLWGALFLNGIEAWANYRRTGFPVLEEVNYPGNVTGGKIARRLQYPTIEPILNKAAYDEAVARQGPDELTTRVWWDVP